MTHSDNMSAAPSSTASVELDITNTRIKLETGRSLCAQNTCPTIYETSNQDWIAVQGYRHHDSAVDEHTPANEEVVLIDRSLLAMVFGCHHEMEFP